VAVVVPLFAPVTFVERGWLSANVLAVTRWLQVLTQGSAYLHRDSPNTNSRDIDDIDDIDAEKVENAL